jgi:hypothetical protein
MADKGMRLSPEKAQIALPELRYMGFIISFDKNGHPVLNAEKSKPKPYRTYRPQRISKHADHLQEL